MGPKPVRIRNTIVQIREHLPQISWEFIHHGRDETLHGAELGVQAEEHQHEEEAGGPDRGEGHLENRTGVGEESKTGS